MKKKNKTLTFIIIGVAIAIIIYMMTRKNGNLAKEGDVGTPLDFSALPQGCYAMEEVHERGSTAPNQMWVSLIKTLADGTSIRPAGNSASNGDYITISNTGSALDGTFRINTIWTDTDGRIGAFGVDIPAGYNFNYNALQGGEPRDVTYAGIGQVCIDN